MRGFLTLLLGAGLSAIAVAAADFPWSGAAPQSIVNSALTPDTVFDETPGDWRPQLGALFTPLVKDCPTAREAVLAVASHMTEVTGAYYSPERRQPCMSPLEALAEKKVSCTGQSILLVCALRSVGIPARAVGIFSWGHIPGNHTWVEAWFDGGWHMIEFNEKDFDTPWVMEAVGMLNPADPAQRVRAVTTAEQADEGVFFPCVWNRAFRPPAEDVTERYLALARAWYARSGLSPEQQRVMIDVQPRPSEPVAIEIQDADGSTLSQAELATDADDFRKLATLTLPRQGGPYYLVIPRWGLRAPISATEPPVQILGLRVTAEHSK